MSHSLDRRWVVAVLSVVVAAIAVASPASAPTGAAAWAALLLLPGLALYLVLERQPRLVEAAAWSLALSPVLVAATAVTAMLAGVEALVSARGLVVAAALVAAAAALRRSVATDDIGGRQLILLAGLAVALCAVTSYLPLTDEWWRVRSDAWAHRAYVAEVADFGVPPMDPYFVGFPLQYMWAYHALVHTISATVRIEPFWTMALINIQALAGLVVMTFLFAGTLTRSFSRRFMSALTVTLGMNAAFWLFLPVKLLKAFTGETRGLDEVARQFSLVPFTYRHTTGFMQIFHNKEFFLDKFMVATAFGLGLCLMAATWWAAAEYLRSGRRSVLVAAFLSLLGLLAFHTLVASVMLAGVLGGLAILFVFRSRVDGFSTGRALALGAALAAALAVAAPYVYDVMASKDAVGQNSPVLIARRFIGVSISIAFVAVLAWYQRWVVRDRSVTSRFVAAAALVVTITAFAVPLPGPNNYDKPPFFIFFPLAVIGAWSLVDLYRRRATLAVVIALVAFVPVNTLALASCFNTPREWSISDNEHELAAWLREHTERTDVMLDDNDHVDFVVIGPRRHLWGRMGFAYQWGYDRLEMSRRYHAWRTVYTDREIDASTLATLGSVETGLYVVTRDSLHAGGVNATRHPEYFQPVYRSGPLGLLRVDTDRCRVDAVSGRFPRVTQEELLRESGL